MDAFVKAAQIHFKDDKIGTKELFKLMEQGKLLSKDILPLVGKELSKAANKGGALEKMLKGNMVAMNRMKQSFQAFQNDVFMGGFGEALTKLFNAIAFGLNTNSNAAKSFGKAIGMVMDQLIDKLTLVYDYTLFLWLEFKHYILDNIPDGIKSVIGETAAWAISIGLIYKAFSGVFNVLKMIAGLGGLSKVLGVAAFMAKLNPIIRGIAIMYGLVQGLMYLLEKDKQRPAPAAPSIGGGVTGSAATSNWMNGASTSYGYRPSIQTAPSAPRASTPTASSVVSGGSQAPAQPSQINIKVDEGMLKGLIDVQIDNNNIKQLNMLGE